MQGGRKEIRGRKKSFLEENGKGADKIREFLGDYLA